MTSLARDKNQNSSFSIRLRSHAIFLQTRCEKSRSRWIHVLDVADKRATQCHIAREWCASRKRTPPLDYERVCGYSRDSAFFWFRVRTTARALCVTATATTTGGLCPALLTLCQSAVSSLSPSNRGDGI